MSGQNQHTEASRSIGIKLEEGYSKLHRYFMDKIKHMQINLW